MLAMPFLVHVNERECYDPRETHDNTGRTGLRNDTRGVEGL